AMARREAEVLARAGIDVAGPQDQIAQAQAAFDLRQFPRAYELAQSAHEGLVRRRGGGAGEGPSPDRVPAPPGVRRPAAAPAGPEATPDGALPAGGTPLPKGRAESHFLIGALGRELAGAPPTAGSTEAARGLLTEAQARFDAGDYPAAFQLALKGRRAIGGAVESLPAGSVPRAGRGTSARGDAEGTAAYLANASRCADCGTPIPSGDAYCRGCGRPLASATCPACGAPRTGSDAFCGRCGATFSA
ncbi:hypothetical protein B2A_01989, partial [mine drainage metagenome]